MKKNNILIIILSIVNIILFAYHDQLDNKIQSYLDRYAEYTYSIINDETELNKFECLYNRTYSDPVFKITTESYNNAKQQFDYFCEGKKFGQIRNTDLVTSSSLCLTTSKRIFNYNIDRNIKWQYNNYISSMFAIPQGMYLHRPTIQILSDHTQEFCDVAFINTDIISYHFDILINEKLPNRSYNSKFKISNSEIEDDLISINVLDPCDEKGHKEFILKI